MIFNKEDMDKAKELVGKRKYDTEGPWNEEPDFHDFIYKGIQCIMNRNMSLGVWCGYIFIDPTSKYETEEQLEQLEVHGGLTYGQHVKKDDKRWLCLGFDCGHANDVWPAVNRDFSDFFDNPTYKDIEFVKNELCKLVDQVLEE